MFVVISGRVRLVREDPSARPPVRVEEEVRFLALQLWNGSAAQHLFFSAQDAVSAQPAFTAAVCCRQVPKQQLLQQLQQQHCEYVPD